MSHIAKQVKPVPIQVINPSVVSSISSFVSFFLCHVRCVGCPSHHPFHFIHSFTHQKSTQTSLQSFGHVKPNSPNWLVQFSIPHTLPDFPCRIFSHTAPPLAFSLYFRPFLVRSCICPHHTRSTDRSFLVLLRGKLPELVRVYALELKYFLYPVVQQRLYWVR